jgi:hypothetical protein
MSNDRERTLLSLPAQPLDRLIDDLQALTEKARASGAPLRPLAVFHLHTGRDLTGWLLHSATSGDGTRSLLVQQRSSRTEPVVTTWFDARSLEAISIFEPQEVSASLSHGTSMRAVPSPPPALTRLELRRAMQQASELAASHGLALQLGAAIDDLPTDTSLFGHVAQLARDTAEVLRGLAADALGTAALAALKHVSLEVGDPGVSKVEDGLVVRARFADGWAGRLSKDELKVALEKLL